MERLTNIECILKTINNAEKDITKLKDIVLRLAEYEDIGLTPDEIERYTIELYNRARKAEEKADYWEREAKKWCAKLGEIRLWIGEQIKI